MYNKKSLSAIPEARESLEVVVSPASAAPQPFEVLVKCDSLRRQGSFNTDDDASAVSLRQPFPQPCL
eukprot:3390532-Rhodomonas_salina.1